MEREEFEALLTDENVVAFLTERYVPKTDFDKVNGKKEQLLSEKKREQDKAKALADQLSKWNSISEQVGQMGFDMDEVVPKFLASLQKQQDGTDDGSSKNSETVKVLEDRMTIQKQTYESKISSMQKEHEKKVNELESYTQRVLKGWDNEKAENTLISEMNRIGVLPAHFKTLKMAFRNIAAVEENEDGVRGVLMLNDNGLKIPATEYFDNFAQSDEGKMYIAAPQTSGGGAVGGRGGRQSIDFNAERNKALQKGDIRSSIGLAIMQDTTKKR